MATKTLQDCFDELVSNSSSLYLDKQIPILSSPPSPLDFYRDFVSWNRPCIIEHAFDHWPANWLWSNSYLRKTMNDQIVTVADTPNGFADAVYDHKYFVLPQQKKMKFYEFINHLELWNDHEPEKCEWNKQRQKEKDTKKYLIMEQNEEEKKNGINVDKNCNECDDENYCFLCDHILYCQQQNGCMKDEYLPLCADIEMEIDFVSKALNKKPDAVNFWMGEDRSISSLHQDPFENVYCVLSGTKHFSLYPPTDEVNLCKTPFQKAMYGFVDGSWNICFDPKWEKIEWIDRIRNEKKCNLMKVKVEKGQMLYLPALWFHEVSQSVDENGRVIAVNFWYDMNYDVRYNLLNFMKSTIKLQQQTKK